MPLFLPIMLGLRVSINLPGQIVRVGVLPSTAWGAVAIYSKNSYKRTESQISCNLGNSGKASSARIFTFALEHWWRHEGGYR